MNDTATDLVTGAFSYSGSAIAERLLDSGRRVRTLTFHPDRAHPLKSRVQTFPYRFEDPAALTRTLEGVSTPALLDRAAHLVFGGQRDVLTNNIAWILRRMPVFAVPGNGRYSVEPVHVDDLARICVDAAAADGDPVFDAAGPETMPFDDLIALIRMAVIARSPILHIPPPLMAAAARGLGLLVRDVVLTPDEIRGLMAGLLVSHDPPWDRSHSASGWTNTGLPSVAPTPTNCTATSPPTSPHDGRAGVINLMSAITSPGIDSSEPASPRRSSRFLRRSPRARHDAQGPTRREVCVDVLEALHDLNHEPTISEKIAFVVQARIIEPLVGLGDRMVAGTTKAPL